MMKRRCVRKTGRVLVPIFAVLLLGGMTFFSPLQGQQRKFPTTERTKQSPEEVVEFYESFLSLYMENYRRINRLKQMRQVGASEDESEMASSIRQKTEETLNKLRENLRSVSPDDVRSRLLRSMKAVLKYYSLYVHKIVTDWEPSEEQVLKRRRLNDSQIVDHHPELATPSLLRRVFLGELVTSVHFVRETRGWFRDRIRNVRNWISSKKKKLYSMYVRLVSRVEKVMLDKEVEEQEKQDVIEKSREEWQTFWKNVGKGSDWKEVRITVNQLSSFFRNRTRRLPGYQSTYREQVKDLQKQIGELQRLKIDRPFVKKKKRLETLLLLSKMFAQQVENLGRQESDLAIEQVSTFMSEHMDQDPSVIWNAEDTEELKTTKQAQLELSTLGSNDLSSINLGLVRESFQFPTDDLMKISNRLSAEFGDRGKKLGESVRVLAEDVQDKLTLITEGVNILKQYNNALSEQEVNGADEMVQFEKSFRSEYQSSIQNVQTSVEQVRERTQNISDHLNRLSNLDPVKLANRFQPGEKAERSE